MLLEQSPAESVDQADDGMLDVAEAEGVGEPADSQASGRRAQDVNESCLMGHAPVLTCR
jgi:hypothetical protein